MKIDIESAEQVGRLIRASRKAMQIRQDDAAGIIGVSENFLGKVERGGETVQWGKLFQVMQGLGLSITIEVPEQFADDIQKVLTDTQKKAAQSAASAQFNKPEAG
ncbi:transcriptional regulator [Pseudomonas sp. RL_15y_Pfl2_60]|uniref:transcriptional regulator n=1 Tax=Pseudomonas sp. RL_15y_Pfl2_60 TaxID=3088709 RepID=UPI0030DC819A